MPVGLGILTSILHEPCRMLQVNPEARATFEQVQAHPWVMQVAAWSIQGGSVYALSGQQPNEQVVAELELGGYPRLSILQVRQGEQGHAGMKGRLCMMCWSVPLIPSSLAKPLELVVQHCILKVWFLKKQVWNCS